MILGFVFCLVQKNEDEVVEKLQLLHHAVILLIQRLVNLKEVYWLFLSNVLIQSFSELSDTWGLFNGKKKSHILWMLKNIFIIMLFEMYKYSTTYILFILLAIKQCVRPKLIYKLSVTHTLKPKRFKWTWFIWCDEWCCATETKLPLERRTFSPQVHRAQLRSALQWCYDPLYVILRRDVVW